MATMIGRECWHCVGGFTYGKIVAHNLDHGSCTILTPGGERKEVAAINVCLTKEAAMRQVEEAIAYWERVQTKLLKDEARDPFNYSKELEARRG